PVFDVYQVLHEKMISCSKPIYPVLPSVTTAKEEVDEFLSRGHINFPDEVVLGEALAPESSEPPHDASSRATMLATRIRRVVSDDMPGDGNSAAPLRR
ncbi:MAG: hypothetical protein QNL12_13245, partial [Acidimicrobiia bacterium]|nr:hypothetical protein [Acidimicrobiia bacterium]MDX2468278.1 hypothetical protein [Acidimicrobiia bacterium]